jgi:hypothetical protein
LRAEWCARGSAVALCWDRQRSPLPPRIEIPASGNLTVPAGACTTFCLRDDGRILFGKNYDWNVPDGLLVVNQRGMARTADQPGGRAAGRQAGSRATAA